MVLKDSKNRYHQVCFQAFEMSCGPASCAMVERIYKHLTRSDEQRALDFSSRFPGGFDIDAGTYASNLTSVLNSEGVSAYAAKNIGSANVASYLRFYACFSTPVIIHIQWANNGGRHFAVCPIYDPSDDSFVFYDPWYGIVEATGSQLPNYVITGGTNTPSGTGQLTGWTVITHH
jgi:hypothetical protein